MKDTLQLIVTAQSEREIVITREFDAPRRMGEQPPNSIWIVSHLQK